MINLSKEEIQFLLANLYEMPAKFSIQLIQFLDQKIKEIKKVEEVVEDPK